MSDQMKRQKAAQRRDHFAKGGTLKQWMMTMGAGRHGDNKSKAARNKKRCREKLKNFQDNP